MILFDTETTGLIGNASLPLSQQPEIIEFAAVKLDDTTLEEVDAISFFVKPRTLPLDPKITKITGITDDMLKGALSFSRHLPVIQEFYVGERICVAHNLSFDLGMLRLELLRHDRVCRFPWPIVQIDTVEENMDVLKVGGRKLAVLYELVTGSPPPVTHRALEDTRTLIPIVRWMRTKGKL